MKLAKKPFQTVRMEQCHAPELPCNYIDPLLKSSCLQVKHTIYGDNFERKSSISDEDSNDGNGDINVMNMHWSCSVDYTPVVTFHFGFSCLKISFLFRSTTLSGYLRTHTRWEERFSCEAHKDEALIITNIKLIKLVWL